jgi:hypothetical protein
MHRLLLRSLGVIDAPGSLAEATSAYLAARSELEGRFGVQIPRDLERTVRPVLTAQGKRPSACSPGLAKPEVRWRSYASDDSSPTHRHTRSRSIGAGSSSSSPRLPRIRLTR